MARVPNEPTIDLKEYEWRINVRRTTIDDFDRLIELQLACFPGMQPWGRDQVESQLAIFPEGQLVVEVDGKVAASSSSLILEYDPEMAWHNWKVVADEGYIRNHQPRGDTLYGIEIMVDPEFRGMKLSRRSYDARNALRPGADSVSGSPPAGSSLRSVRLAIGRPEQLLRTGHRDP